MVMGPNILGYEFYKLKNMKSYFFMFFPHKFVPKNIDYE